jgi:hypothetical protein
MGRRIVRTLAALAVALSASVAVSGAASPALASPALASPALASPASASPVLAPADDQLGGVACPSASHCIAVGANFATQTPLAETWTTLGWRKIAVKLPAGVAHAELNAVTCPAVKTGVFCVAAGDYFTTAGAPFALTEIWNGSTWTPAKASGTSGTFLNSVSCLSAVSCLAVGGHETISGTGAPIADVWNGKSWKQVAVTAPAHAMLSEFTGVSCATATFCVATGNTASASGSMTALIGRWNGKTWSYLKPAAAPKGVFDVSLTGVSCPAANSCVTAGNGALPKGGTGSFIETWNGKAWVRAAAITWPKGTRNPWLVGMSCYAARHCFAAGYIDWNPLADGGNTGRAAAAQWNGKSWTSTPVTPPGAGKATLFDAVTCRSASFCVAVGLAGPFGQSAGTGLSGFWNGKTWKLVAAK